MIDIEIMQDASEIIHYDSNKLPYAIQERLLSNLQVIKLFVTGIPTLNVSVFTRDL